MLQRTAKLKNKEKAMYMVTRTYSGAGAKELFDLLEQRKGDVKEVMGDVPGIKSYAMVRTPDGGYTVTLCEGKSGIDDSVKVAAAWIKKNAPDLTVQAPVVAEGEVIQTLN
jgi:ABC-type Fe3+-hydroxamate transport system substrate-binding protein